jgi:type IV pilus assembly protein PilE
MLSQCPSRRPRGFTLIESMIALGISATLASIAYPSFADQVRKAHRSDAIVRLATLQLAQERWRSGNPSYGSLAEIGIAAQTADGLYQLSVSANQATGYVAVAAAQGGQLRDAPCRFLQLTVNGGNTTRASGPDASVNNAAALNDRCWNR